MFKKKTKKHLSACGWGLCWGKVGVLKKKWLGVVLGYGWRVEKKKKKAFKSGGLGVGWG